MTDERQTDSPYASPIARIAPADATGLPSIWPRLVGTLAATSIPSAALMLDALQFTEVVTPGHYVAALLLWGLPSWFVLWPTIRASGGWRHTAIHTRIMVPSLFAIVLGVSTFVLTFVLSMAFSIHARLQV